MSTAFNQIDGMDIVCVYDTGTTDTAQDLGEDVRWNLAPWEVAHSSEGDRYSRVYVTTRDAARDPYTKRSACRVEPEPRSAEVIDDLNLACTNPRPS